MLVGRFVPEGTESRQRWQCDSPASIVHWNHIHMLMKCSLALWSVGDRSSSSSYTLHTHLIMWNKDDEERRRSANVRKAINPSLGSTPSIGRKLVQQTHNRIICTTHTHRLHSFGKTIGRKRCTHKYGWQCRARIHKNTKHRHTLCVCHIMAVG